MKYLVRYRLEKPHHIAHLVHEVGGVTGALCSHKAKPAVGDWSQGGEWQLIDKIPPEVCLCQRCQKKKDKLANPLPARVERELEKLALWDPRAAALQREKMLAFYRQKYASR